MSRTSNPHLHQSPGYIPKTLLHFLIHLNFLKKFNPEYAQKACLLKTELRSDYWDVFAWIKAQRRPYAKVDHMDFI